MNKLNDEEHRRPEFSNTTAKEERTVKTIVEKKFEKDGKPVDPTTADRQTSRPTKE